VTEAKASNTQIKGVDVHNKTKAAPKEQTTKKKHLIDETKST